MQALKSDAVAPLVAAGELVVAGGGVAQLASVSARAPKAAGISRDFFTKMPPWHEYAGPKVGPAARSLAIASAFGGAGKAAGTT